MIHFISILNFLSISPPKRSPTWQECFTLPPSAHSSSASFRTFRAKIRSSSSLLRSRHSNSLIQTTAQWRIQDRFSFLSFSVSCSDSYAALSLDSLTSGSPPSCGFAYGRCKIRSVSARSSSGQRTRAAAAAGKMTGGGT